MNELEKKAHMDILISEERTRVGIEEETTAAHYKVMGYTPRPMPQLYRDNFKSDEAWSEYYNRGKEERLNRIDLAAKENPDGLSPETLPSQSMEIFKC